MEDKYEKSLKEKYRKKKKEKQEKLTNSREKSTEMHRRRDNGVLFSSAGRAGFPCTEDLSLLQWPRVRVPAWNPLLQVSPPLSHPVSCHL